MLRMLRMPLSLNVPVGLVMGHVFHAIWMGAVWITRGRGICHRRVGTVVHGLRRLLIMHRVGNRLWIATAGPIRLW